jgi:hypothetical protein
MVHIALGANAGISPSMHTVVSLCEAPNCVDIQGEQNLVVQGHT